MEHRIFSYRGLFQWWSYTVSHGQLLLRSTKSSDRPTQIDILFKNVKWVRLRTLMKDLEVLETSSDPENLVRDAGVSVRFFLIRSLDHEGYVVAGNVVSDESNREYYDDSPLLPKID